MSAALLRQIHPLQWDTSRNEPFLRLPAPLSHIILTPPRSSDAVANLGPMNDPRVYNGLQSPPWPYTLEASTSWNNVLVKNWEDELKKLEDIAAQGEDASLATFAFCPVRCIRDPSSAEGEFIGDISIGRTRFEWEVDEVKRKELAEANAALPFGDPSIVYTIGDWLAPSYHGQGIMSVVVKAVITQWAIPRMNARHFRPTAFKDNNASVKVFTKMGFKHLGVVPNIAPVQARGEFPAEMRSINVLELKVDEEGNIIN